MTRRDLEINTILTPVLLAAVAGLALAVSAHHFLRFDLTRDGDFSLEPVTLELVQSIPDPLTIRVYFTRDIEPPYHTMEGEVRDLLDEYRAHNPAHMRIEWVDPTEDPELQAEAVRLGVEPATLQVMAEGRREVREIWMGMAFVYRDRIEALPTLQSVEDLEYQVTRRIRAVVEDRREPVVGFLAGHGEPDVAEGAGSLEGVLRAIDETYEVRKVLLGSGALVPDDIDVLVVLGPREPLQEDERFAIDQYLMSGRPAAFFRSSFTPDARTRELHRSSDNLGDLLAHYGIAMETWILADRFSNGLMPTPTRRGQTGYVNHPLIPLVDELDRDNVITRGVDTLSVPLSSPLTLPEERPGCPECVIHELAFTGKRSVALPLVTSLDPVDYIKPMVGELPGPFLVIAALEGSLHTFYSETSREVDDHSPEGTRVLVMASADFVLKDLGFFLNSLDWLVLDADLLALRPDRSLPPVLRPLGATTSHLVRLVNLALVPALVVVFTVLRAQRRRRR